MAANVYIHEKVLTPPDSHSKATGRDALELNDRRNSLSSHTLSPRLLLLPELRFWDEYQYARYSMKDTYS